eukprot:gene6477-4664_t
MIFFFSPPCLLRHPTLRTWRSLLGCIPHCAFCLRLVINNMLLSPSFPPVLLLFDFHFHRGTEFEEFFFFCFSSAMQTTDVENVNTSAQELEQYRRDARVMELKLLRKEADVRRAEEEMLLRRELQDANDMIVEKLKNEELMESARLPIDVEHRAEIKALEDALKIENRKTELLRSEVETMEGQIVVVESELEKTNTKLAEVKEATGWDVDMVMAREGAANLNEFLEKKKVLAGLHEQQQTEKNESDRLTSEIEELITYIQEQDGLDEQIATAQEMYATELEKHNQLCNEEKSLEHLAKKKERALNAPQKDDYHDIRYLEGEKRAAHNALLTLRDSGAGNSSSLTSVDTRIRQLESKLETLNVFLQQHFRGEENLPPMEGVPEGAEDVEVALFNRLCNALEKKRAQLLEQDDKMESYDATIEQLQLKINVLRAALISNNVSSQLYSQQQEKETNALIAHLENLNAECDEVEAKVTEENQALRRQQLQNHKKIRRKNNNTSAPPFTDPTDAIAFFFELLFDFTVCSVCLSNVFVCSLQHRQDAHYDDPPSRDALILPFQEKGGNANLVCEAMGDDLGEKKGTMICINDFLLSTAERYGRHGSSMSRRQEGVLLFSLLSCVLLCYEVLFKGERATPLFLLIIPSFHSPPYLIISTFSYQVQAEGNLAAMQQLVEEVQSKFGISVSSRYAERALAAHPGLTADGLLKRILLDDLKEVTDCSTLPLNITSQSSATIPKAIVLQISSSRDATQPLRPSADASAEEVALHAAGQKSSTKRLLRLILTDGHSEIIGMELSTLRVFRGIPIPGEKVRIQEGAQVKNGAIIFSENNVEFLGGEVRALKQEFLEHRRRLQQGYQTSMGIDGAPRFQPLSVTGGTSSGAAQPKHCATTRMERHNEPNTDPAFSTKRNEMNGRGDRPSPRHPGKSETSTQSHDTAAEQYALQEPQHPRGRGRGRGGGNENRGAPPQASPPGPHHQGNFDLNSGNGYGAQEQYSRGRGRGGGNENRGAPPQASPPGPHLQGNFDLNSGNGYGAQEQYSRGRGRGGGNENRGAPPQASPPGPHHQGNFDLNSGNGYGAQKQYSRGRGRGGGNEKRGAPPQASPPGPHHQGNFDLNSGNGYGAQEQYSRGRGRGGGNENRGAPPQASPPGPHLQGNFDLNSGNGYGTQKQYSRGRGRGGGNEKRGAPPQASPPGPQYQGNFDLNSGNGYGAQEQYSRGLDHISKVISTLTAATDTASEAVHHMDHSTKVISTLTAATDTALRSSTAVVGVVAAGTRTVVPRCRLPLLDHSTKVISTLTAATDTALRSSTAVAVVVAGDLFKGKKKGKECPYFCVLCISIVVFLLSPFKCCCWQFSLLR